MHEEGDSGDGTQQRQHETVLENEGLVSIGCIAALEQVTRVEKANFVDCDGMGFAKSYL